MELPVRLTRVQRALAAALLVPVLAVAWLESRSPAASCARTGEPWTAFFALATPGAAVPRLFWAVYNPVRRTGDLIYLPETTQLPGERTTLAKAYAAARRDGGSEMDGAKAMAEAAEKALLPAPKEAQQAQGDGPVFVPGRFYYDEQMGPADAEEEPPLAGLRFLREHVSGNGLWRALARRHGGRGLEPFELFRVAVEWHSIKDDDLRAAYFPEDADERRSYIQRLLGEPGPAQARETTVEILNASGKPGFASGLKKILRSKGADVMSTGNAPPRSRTLVLDRVGRPELAAQVRRMLNCPSARALTQIDAKRLVDVSVVIADDCPQRE